MAEINAKDVMGLRQKTGVSMMACKKALLESGGDMEKAEEFLRKQGELKAASKAERETSEGVVAVSGNAIASVRCETDFVARNDDFLSFVQGIADEAKANGEAAAKEKFENEKTDLFTKLGENMTFGEVHILDADVVGSYVHSNRKVAALVGLNGGNEDIARDVAMHVTAMNPAVVSPEEVSDELVEKEKEIWREQLLNEGKPEQILDKIMIGKEKKFREEAALVKQSFVKNQEQTVEQYVQENGASVKGYVRVEV